MNLRPFEDLIKTIEYDGETFIPIEEIAKTAMSDITDSTTKVLGMSISKFGVAECIINRHVYETDIKYCFYVTDTFNVFCNHNLEKMSVFNQVQIVKNLIKWGFVEP